ncbi:hypothetical protein D3C84_834550 [compost metagenome]
MTSLNNHFAIVTFWALPPLSSLTRMSGELALMESCWMASQPRFSSRCSLGRQLNVDTEFRAGREVLRQISKSGTRPCFIRSSGTRPMPAFTEAPVLRPISRPLRMTLPEACGSAPNAACSSSLRPEPRRPAIPMTSPAASFSDVGCSLPEDETFCSSSTVRDGSAQLLR